MEPTKEELAKVQGYIKKLEWIEESLSGIHQQVAVCDLTLETADWSDELREYLWTKLAERNERLFEQI